jgi:predicted ATPase/DNA-binding winged helix-turn-helix (wHTH) protein
MQAVPSPADPSILFFHGFTVSPAERKLLVGTQPVKISARAFDLLLALINARDRVVSKDELLDRIWPGLVVEENNLQVHVSQLRKLCGAQAIATVPGRGYRFVARSVSAESEALGGTPLYGESMHAQALTCGMGNLPATVPPLFGRETEVRELSEALSKHRWVTISGAGGVGKTHLAVTLGHTVRHRIGDGVWFVELAAVMEPHMVCHTVAQTVGATIVNMRNPIDGLVSTLSDRNTLLVLDNCEHLLDAVGELCAALLQKLPLLRILLTSQEVLRGNDEHVYKLGSLEVPDPEHPELAAQTGAMRLLVTRVQSVSRQFRLTDDTLLDAIAICRQLDGLPLAIELVAARVHLLGLAGVRQRLGELFRLLTGDARVHLRRHQTIRAALDWSYSLLNKDERELFCTLGVFAGGFSLEAAQHIATQVDRDEWMVLDTLSSLVDKSLVHVSVDTCPRYSMLEVTRTYAMEQLALTGATDEVLARHASTTRMICELASQRRDIKMAWAEVANVRAAFGWASKHDSAELAVALATLSSVVLAVGGLVGESIARLLSVESMVNESLPMPLVAQYWQWLGRCGIDGRLPPERCVLALETAETLFRQMRNQRHVHACLRMRAEALLELGDMEGARESIHSARSFEDLGESAADRMRRLRVEGLILHANGRTTEAMNLLRQALSIAEPLNIYRYRYTLIHDIGLMLLDMGDAPGAQMHFVQILSLPRSNPSLGLVTAYARISITLALLVQDQFEEARQAALAALSPALVCNILLSNAEVFAWLLARLQHYQAADFVLQASDWFRSVTRSIRTATETNLRESTLVTLRSAQLPQQTFTGPCVESKLAEFIGATLADEAHDCQHNKGAAP